MTSYMRPGVYTIENLTPLQNGNGIPGEACACFVAPYNVGPTVPTFVKSWPAYVAAFGDFTAASPQDSLLPFAVYTYFANGGTGCFILRMPNTDAIQAETTVTDIASTHDPLALVQAKWVGAWGSLLYLEVVSAGTAGNVNINIYYVPVGKSPIQSYLVEQFQNVSANPLSPRYVVTIVNSPVSGSRYVTWTENADTLAAQTPPGYSAGNTDFTLNPGAPAQFVIPQRDGVDVPNLGDGEVAPVLGVDVPVMLDNYLTQQVLNINLPGEVDPAVLNPLVAWAEARDDCMLFIDGPPPNLPETSAQVVANYLDMLTEDGINASTYGTIHAPWLLINDPSSSNPGATKYVPPSGTVLGKYALADVMEGPQQAGAGTSYGRISVVDLECRFNPDDLDTLNVNMINAIKAVPGNGFCVFGVRTLLPGFPSMYVPVRRTLMKLEHDCVELTQFALFEPNVPRTWNNVVTVLNTYLTQMTAAHMLGSENPQDAFLVICNSTNNPPASAQAGIMNVSVAVSLGSPAEFILITISQLQSGVTTSSTSTT